MIKKSLIKFGITETGKKNSLIRKAKNRNLWKNRTYKKTPNCTALNTVGQKIRVEQLFSWANAPVGQMFQWDKCPSGTTVLWEKCCSGTNVPVGQMSGGTNVSGKNVRWDIFQVGLMSCGTIVSGTVVTPPTMSHSTHALGSTCSVDP